MPVPCRGHRAAVGGKEGGMSKLDELKQLSSYLRKTGFDADAKNVDAAIEHVEELEATTQRLWDLARHYGYEIYRHGLITDDEYVTLAQNRDAVHRLEDYDASRKLIERLDKRIDKLREVERLSAKRIEEPEAQLNPFRELAEMVLTKRPWDSVTYTTALEAKARRAMKEDGQK